MNYIYLRPGRASSCNFVIRSVATNSKLPQAVVTIITSDSMIKLSPTIVALSPGIRKASFMIGVPCLYQTGSYFTTFPISDTTNYYPLQPINLFVDAIGTVSSVRPPATISVTAQGGTQQVSLTIFDYPVDKRIYTFYGDLINNTTQNSSSTVATEINFITPNSNITIASFNNSGIFHI